MSEQQDNCEEESVDITLASGGYFHPVKPLQLAPAYNSFDKSSSQRNLRMKNSTMSSANIGVSMSGESGRNQRSLFSPNNRTRQRSNQSGRAPKTTRNHRVIKQNQIDTLQGQVGGADRPDSIMNSTSNIRISDLIANSDNNQRGGVLNSSRSGYADHSNQERLQANAAGPFSQPQKDAQIPGNRQNKNTEQKKKKGGGGGGVDDDANKNDPMSKIPRNIREQIFNPQQMMYQDAMFLTNYKKILVQKANIETEIKDLKTKIQNAELSQQLGMINEMVEELFQTVDDCILQIEEGREQMSEVARVLLTLHEQNKDPDVAALDSEGSGPQREADYKNPTAAAAANQQKKRKYPEIKNMYQDIPEVEQSMSDNGQQKYSSFRNSHVNLPSDSKKNANGSLMEAPDFTNDLFSQNKISMKDIDNYLSQNQMNFNFNDNLFTGIEDDIEKEIMGLKQNRPGGQNNKKGADSGISGGEQKLPDEETFNIAELQKELERLNINVNDLDMLDKNDHFLNKLMMEAAAQGKPGGIGLPQNQVIMEEDEQDNSDDSQKSDRQKKKSQVKDEAIYKTIQEKKQGSKPNNNNPFDNRLDMLRQINNEVGKQDPIISSQNYNSNNNGQQRNEPKLKQSNSIENQSKSSATGGLKSMLPFFQ